MSHPPAVLSCRGLAPAPDGRPLFHGFDLELRAGELVALGGPSGGGKTSLLRAICGLDDAAAGEVLLDGQPPAVHGWPLFRRRVLLVPQEPRLPEGTVGDALARPFAFGSAGAAFDTGTAERTLGELFAAPPDLEQDTGKLSVGERQRICLARALLLAPPVLLLDEPTSALDPRATAGVERAVRRRAEADGLAAFIVSHLPEQASRWCDRVLTLPGVAA